MCLPYHLQGSGDAQVLQLTLEEAHSTYGVRVALVGAQELSRAAPEPYRGVPRGSVVIARVAAARQDVPLVQSHGDDFVAVAALQKRLGRKPTRPRHELKAAPAGRSATRTKQFSN